MHENRASASAATDHMEVLDAAGTVGKERSRKSPVMESGGGKKLWDVLQLFKNTMMMAMMERYVRRQDEIHTDYNLKMDTAAWKWFHQSIVFIRKPDYWRACIRDR